MLSLNADINAVDNNGNNFLMKSYRILENSNFDLQKYIDQGLNINTINNKDEGILCMMNMHNNIVYDNYRILLKNGIRFDNYSDEDHIGHQLYVISEKRYPYEKDGRDRSMTEDLRLDYQILLASGYKKNNRNLSKKEELKENQLKNKDANIAKKIRYK